MGCESYSCSVPQTMHQHNLWEGLLNLMPSPKEMNGDNDKTVHSPETFFS